MLAALVTLILLPTADPPTSAYTPVTLQGFTVMVETRLKNDSPETHKKTFALLESQLKDVVRVVPADKLPVLRKTKIWVDFASRSQSAMVYHPSRTWLEQNNYNLDKARSVELSHPQKFLDWSAHQPYMTLHELAHAYHDQVHGFSDPEISGAYHRAKTSGKYEEVKHINGQTQRHYGMNNPMEFFAEMTETYFGKNDFYPFTRQELKEYDPETYEWIKHEWTVRQPAQKQ